MKRWIFASLLLAPLALSNTAHANPAIDNLQKAVAPKAKKTGQVFQGTKPDNEFFVTLSSGKCYWFVGATEPGAKILHFWMFTPKNKNVGEQKGNTPNQHIAHCPDAPGNFKLVAKVRPPVPFTVEMFEEEGPPAGYHADGRRNDKAWAGPAQVAAGGAVAPGSPVGSTILDPGPVTPGTNAALQVGCNCQAMEIYVDGQLYNSQQGSFRISDLGSGTHQLKIVGWPNPFKREKYFEGQINLHANMESRIHVGKAGAAFLGKNPIPPPPPPARVASDRTYADIDASIELLRDAQELARDDGCGRRIDEKFQSLSESLRWVRENVSAANLADVSTKTHDVAEYAQDACSPRIAGAVEKKLSRMRQRLDAAKRSVD